MPLLSNPKGLLKPPRFVGERRKRIRIAKKVHCEWVLNNKGTECIWEPAIPEKFSNAMWKRYIEGRDAFMAELSLEMGPSAVVDMNGDITAFHDGTVTRRGQH